MTPTDKAMIDASYGGALMNKTPEGAWELIETVAGANQHFNTRANSKGVYELAPSESTVLAKSLVDIAAMLKEIKESQPQNSQNPRYQPPHNRQQYSPATNPPFNFDEAIRTVQRENQEMREAQKRTESQLNHLAELLLKIANQSPVNLQAQAQPSALSPLPSQPLPNPKGGINTAQVEIDNEGEDEAEDEEGENDWLYELLKELANSDECDNEEEDENIEEESEEESDEEEESELAEEEDINDRDKRKIFFINTLFKEKKSEEEIPIKCEDPGPCLVTCKIRGVSILDCLCDPGACGNIMPFEIDKGKVRERSPKERKKAVARVKEKSRGKARDVERSSDNSSKSEGKKKKTSSNPENKKKKKRKKEPDEGKDKKDQKKKPNKAEEKKKKKDPGEDEVKQKRIIRCSSFNRLLGNLKVLKRILR
ncbi:hypothetical protein PIB30_089473 [Stylosanthes scabra]|uniref:Uncharacterized protein n=1 Tax=Stylosanthes scabra TaxID=79078 RepID=A0ABU6SWD5_9FABA|nr:hypothetical protein [Stylosanthes scabra]